MSSYDISKLRFLILERHALVQRLFRDVLREFRSNQIDITSDVDQAYELFSRNTPDMIFTDWTPELDGIDFIRRVRTDSDSPNPFIPVVMVTAHSELVRVCTARDAGMTEFLAKPVSAKLIYNRICRVIENQRQFVNCATFFGPDRRRRDGIYIHGRDRRISHLPQARGLTALSS